MTNPLEAYLSGTQLETDVSGTQIVGARVAVDQSAGKIQRIMAGIPVQSLAAAASADVAVTVSEPFRPERLILETAAQALQVNNLRIGTKSLNVTNNPISGNCFSEDSVGSHVVGYTAQAGVGFVLSLTNPTAGAVSSGGGVFGLALN